MLKWEGVYMYTHTHRVKYFARRFWYSYTAKRIRLKCLSYHRNWLGISSPLILSTPSYSLPLKSLQEVVTFAAGRQMKESLECDQTNRMLDSALLLLFESDKHNDNLLSRPCLLRWKPHSKHGLICRREASLQSNLVYAPSRFDRKTTSICFKIISIC